MATASILTITLNPALDVTTSVGQVRPQQKLRCGTPRYDTGGGGVNVSRAIKELGGESRMFVALGGAAGQHYRGLLGATGIETEIWDVAGETRFSLTVMEGSSGKQFRFVLPGPEQPPDAADALLAALGRSMDDGVRFVVASGRVLPGLPPDLYARVAAEARRRGVVLILDTSGPSLPAALAGRPYLVKMDHYEAQEFLDTSDEPSAVAHAAVDEIIGRGAADAVIVTIGEDGAIVATADMRVQIRPPQVEMVSAVGAGDSFTAALTLGLAKGWPLEVASRFGVAAAASSVTKAATQLCDRAQTLDFFDRIAGSVVQLA
ncbi:MAG: 1-phosphofructokinase family hexose kinase [Devosia sp.]|nr:1-phosphofructokinase family hexose kinase [Devosia sp.]